MGDVADLITGITVYTHHFTIVCSFSMLSYFSFQLLHHPANKACQRFELTFLDPKVKDFADRND